MFMEMIFVQALVPNHGEVYETGRGRVRGGVGAGRGGGEGGGGGVGLGDF